MRHRWMVVLVAIVLGSAGLVQTAAAGEASDYLRGEIDALYKSVGPSDGDAAAPGPASRAIVERMFDWPAMAQASLATHWRARTPAERAQFTQLFTDLFTRAYLSRIHLVDAKTFQYLGDTMDGDKSLVKTKVFTKRGSALDVDYQLARSTPGPRWLVQDVRVEKISLVDNYRVQFDAIVAKSSYEDLVSRLRSATK
jgi:phospholipid transport system substrate-binding protein